MASSTHAAAAAAAATTATPSTDIRRRKNVTTGPAQAHPRANAGTGLATLDGPMEVPSVEDAGVRPAPKKGRPQWLFWALASGGFAACNGVFAKLTTTTQTHGLASYLSHVLGYSESNPAIEIATRCLFFALNLLSNAIMWILFTRALTAATSTTRVSILNTSANFMVTAGLGFLVFGESLPLGWWFGASLLVAGSVVIGARDEGNKGDASADVNANETEGNVALRGDVNDWPPPPKEAGEPDESEDEREEQRYMHELNQEDTMAAKAQPS